MTDITRCRLCGNALTSESMLKLSNMPAAVQNLPTNKDQAMVSGAVLDVRQCLFCGLMQLSGSPVPYYKDVIRPGGVSSSMKARQYDQFKIFVDRFSLMKRNILEVGSGRGEYLAILSELSVNAFGMEHNAESAQIAREKGLKMFQAYPVDLFAPPEGIMFDAFISINVLEHAIDPGAFLRSCANFLADNGVGLISVPDLELELSDNYLFGFMSDHLSYFSPVTLHNALSINGFEVIEIFKNTHLNVITAYVSKRGHYDLTTAKEKSKNLNDTINNYVKKILNSGGRIAVWGASHFAFSIISSSKTANAIAYIVDSSLLKQGRFAPASGIEIFPPEHLRKDPVNAILIMCPEYSAEIAAVIEKQYSDRIHHIATFIDGALEIIK